MKTVKILVLISILAVTQLFALSKTQKNFLLGLGAGAIIVHTLKSHNNSLQNERPHHKVVYVDSHRKHKKRHVRKHHKYMNSYYSHNNHFRKHKYDNHSRYNDWNSRNFKKGCSSRY